MAKLDHMIKYNGEFYSAGEDDPRVVETPMVEPPKDELPKDETAKVEPLKEDKKTTK